MDYKITAKLFETTYANVFNWVKKYKEKGEDGLGDKRDLYDRIVVGYEVGDHNNNILVFNTFDKAVKDNPNARPLFHSGRGF